MRSYKVIAHDLRHGLGRKRYLAMPLLFVVPCLLWIELMRNAPVQGTLGDCLAYIWMGRPPIRPEENPIMLPYFWMLTIIGSLYLNLDYLLNDLTQFGQQIIFRIGSRRSWYLSKCLWNTAVCALYLLVCLLCAILSTILVGGRMTWQMTPEMFLLFADYIPAEPMTAVQCLCLYLLLPYLAVLAFNLVQMTLCLFVKPVISFLFSLSLVILTIFWHSPFLFGNGAMVVRSGLLYAKGLSPVTLGFSALVVILVAVLAGCIRFEKMDILSMEK